MEHHVQSIDDALVGGLSYKLKAGASYVSDRRSVTFFASGGNQYSPSGVNVCKLNIVADQWLDPVTFRVMFTVNNTGNTPSETIHPLHWNPAVTFRRARVTAGGQIIEDIDDFNRLSLMFTALKSQDDQKEIAMEGSGLFDRKYDRAAGGLLADPEAEDGDERKIIVFRIGTKLATLECLGQFYLSLCLEPWHKRLIPLRYCPLQIELELVNSGSDCMFVGDQNGLTSSNK